MADPVGYRLDWRPADPCYLRPEDYAREISKEGADTWGLFTEPQPGCPPEVEVYHGWCWVQPKYVFKQDLTGFTPLYRGQQIHRGTMHPAVDALFPRFLEDRLHSERPELWDSANGVAPAAPDQPKGGA